MLRLGSYELDDDSGRPKTAVLSDPLFDSDFARLADAVESLSRHGTSLKVRQDGEQPEAEARLSLLRLRLRSSLQILDYLMKSDHVRNGCAMIAPEIVTNVFKAVYKAVGEALDQDPNYQDLKRRLSAPEKGNQADGFPFTLRKHSEHLLGPAQ